MLFLSHSPASCPTKSDAYKYVLVKLFLEIDDVAVDKGRLIAEVPKLRPPLTLPS